MSTLSSLHLCSQQFGLYNIYAFVIFLKCDGGFMIIVQVIMYILC